MSATARIESFPIQRGTDRGFFLLLLTLIWAGIVAGFGPDLFLHLEGHHVAYAWIVHVHAIAYLGWLAPPLGILSQVLMVWIYTLPGWTTLAVRLIGR